MAEIRSQESYPRKRAVIPAFISDKQLATVLGPAVGLLGKRVNFVDPEYGPDGLAQASLEYTNSCLGKGGRIMAMANHPGHIENLGLIAVGDRLTHRNRDASGFFMAKGFWDGNYGIVGDVLFPVADSRNFQLFPTARQKEIPDKEERDAFNQQHALQPAQNISKTGGGVLGLYPEATRTEEMLEAKSSGINVYGILTSQTLPLTVNFKGLDWRVVVHTPVDIKQLKRVLKPEIGKTERMAVPDLLMTQVAGSLPRSRQGFYSPFLRAEELAREIGWEPTRESIGEGEMAERVKTYLQAKPIFDELNKETWDRLGL